MRGELVLERSTGELRAAWIEDGEVVELDIVREPPTKTEAIYNARVTARTADGGAFLDLGGGRSGFVPRAEKAIVKGRYLPVQLGPAAAERGKARTVSARPRITGRYLTLIVGAQGVERTGSEAALDACRADLGAALADLAGGCRLVLDPAAAFVPRETVLGEARSLAMEAAQLKAAAGTAGEIRAASEPLLRLLRKAPPQPAAIHVSDSALLAEARRRAAAWPDILKALTLWRGREPLFAAFGAEDAWHTVLEGVMALPSGGRITLEETQAAGIIDVDSGTAAGRGRTEDARLIANCEAAAAVARLLRLAAIGGLVVVDFIDPSSRKGRDAVLAALDAALARDPLPVQRSGMNGHGVVTLTRPRRCVPLRARLLERHPPQPSLETRALAWLRRAEREAVTATPGALEVAIEPDVADWIDHRGYLDRLQSRIGRPVSVTRDP